MSIQLLTYIVPMAVMLILGVSAGGFLERRHLRSLARREAEVSGMLITNLKRIPNPEMVEHVTMVGGQVVVATDYFKTFMTTLRNLIGGEMKAAQTLLLRARREATLRMIADARKLGANEIWNVRYAFCNITQLSGNKGAIAVEIFAYGTAVVRK